jgi:hypothetical protein
MKLIGIICFYVASCIVLNYATPTMPMWLQAVTAALLSGAYSFHESDSK